MDTTGEPLDAAKRGLKTQLEHKRRLAPVADQKIGTDAFGEVYAGAYSKVLEPDDEVPRKRRLK